MDRIETSPAAGAPDTSPWPAPEHANLAASPLFATLRTSNRSLWILAIAGFAFAAVAANIMCLSPRWYSNRFIAFIYEPVRFVVLTAAFGGAAVQLFWQLLGDLPSTGRLRIVRYLSGGWVFLPCFVLLYEANSLLMLLVVALVAVGLAFGLRQILPTIQPATLPYRPAEELPSLDGLPPADSPLTLALSIAILLQVGFICAFNGLLLLSSYTIAFSIFLFAWRWAAVDPRSVGLWNGKHPPLRQASIAILLTAVTLTPFGIGRDIGFLTLHRPGPKVSATKRPSDANAASGYYGIILYPPPRKKEIVAPVMRMDPLRAGAMTRPMNIPFNGQYWYFKLPNPRPDRRAHVAHGSPTDAAVNPRSTDRNGLRMEAHQTLTEPVDLACCSELDISLTNADDLPGEIGLLVSLGNSAAPAMLPQMLGPQTIVSSQADVIPETRPPVKEVLRFRIPPSRAHRRFDEISIIFLPAQKRARTGAKVSIDSFELIPRP